MKGTKMPMKKCGSKMRTEDAKCGSKMAIKTGGAKRTFRIRGKTPTAIVIDSDDDAATGDDDATGPRDGGVVHARERAAGGLVALLLARGR